MLWFIFIVVVQLLCRFCSISSDEVSVTFDAGTDPHRQANSVCQGKDPSCIRRVLPLIQLRKFEHYGGSLNWKYDKICGCLFPPQKRLTVIQYLHIPKAGTSINWFLHDYFNCSATDMTATEPCPRWLETPEEQVQGLCDGQLFSCMGHSVSSSLPQLVINGEASLITFLREPWARLQSDYHYSSRHPQSAHLGPNLSLASALAASRDAWEYALFPGVANCATKMLNGYHCGDDVELTEEHLHIAQRVLDSALFVGISELFRTSICQFAWMYGGVPAEKHFRRSRVGNYTRFSVNDTSVGGEASRRHRMFLASEKYDLALYAYAVLQFRENLLLTGCPVIDH